MPVNKVSSYVPNIGLNFDASQKKVDPQPSADLLKENFHQQFRQKAMDHDSFHQMMRQSFSDGNQSSSNKGTTYNYEDAEVLRQKSLEGNLSWLPEVKMLSASEFSQAELFHQGQASDSESFLGDFGDETIFLNESILSDPELAFRVYSEEAGHAIDKILNQDRDTLGDEGAIFSMLLVNKSLSTEQIQTLKAENDSGVIAVNGQQLEVEFFDQPKLSTQGVEKYQEDLTDVLDDIKGRSAELEKKYGSGYIYQTDDKLTGSYLMAQRIVRTLIHSDADPKSIEVFKSLDKFLSNALKLQGQEMKLKKSHARIEVAVVEQKDRIETAQNQLDQAIVEGKSLAEIEPLLNDYLSASNRGLNMLDHPSVIKNFGDRTDLFGTHDLNSLKATIHTGQNKYLDMAQAAHANTPSLLNEADKATVLAGVQKHGYTHMRNFSENKEATRAWLIDAYITSSPNMDSYTKSLMHDRIDIMVEDLANLATVTNPEELAALSEKNGVDYAKYLPNLTFGSGEELRGYSLVSKFDSKNQRGTMTLNEGLLAGIDNFESVGTNQFWSKGEGGKLTSQFKEAYGTHLGRLLGLEQRGTNKALIRNGDEAEAVSIGGPEFGLEASTSAIVTPKRSGLANGLDTIETVVGIATGDIDTGWEFDSSGLGNTEQDPGITPGEGKPAFDFEFGGIDGGVDGAEADIQVTLNVDENGNTTVSINADEDIFEIIGDWIDGPDHADNYEDLAEDYNNGWVPFLEHFKENFDKAIPLPDQRTVESQDHKFSRYFSPTILESISPPHEIGMPVRSVINDLQPYESINYKISKSVMNESAPETLATEDKWIKITAIPDEDGTLSYQMTLSGETITANGQVETTGFFTDPDVEDNIILQENYTGSTDPKLLNQPLIYQFDDLKEASKAAVFIWHGGNSETFPIQKPPEDSDEEQKTVVKPELSLLKDHFVGTEAVVKPELGEQDTNVSHLTDIGKFYSTFGTANTNNFEISEQNLLDTRIVRLSGSTIQDFRGENTGTDWELSSEQNIQNGEVSDFNIVRLTVVTNNAYQAEVHLEKLNINVDHPVAQQFIAKEMSDSGKTYEEILSTPGIQKKFVDFTLMMLIPSADAFNLLTPALPSEGDKLPEVEGLLGTILGAEAINIKSSSIDVYQPDFPSRDLPPSSVNIQAAEVTNEGHQLVGTTEFTSIRGTDPFTVFRVSEQRHHPLGFDKQEHYELNEVEDDD
jgi:hypothetical protein